MKDVIKGRRKGSIRNKGRVRGTEEQCREGYGEGGEERD